MERLKKPRVLSDNLNTISIETDVKDLGKVVIADDKEGTKFEESAVIC